MTTSYAGRLTAMTWALSFLVASAVVAQTPIVPNRFEHEVPDPNAPTKTKKVIKVTVPVRLGQHPDMETDEHPVAALTRIYKTGNGRRLNNLGVEIAETVSCEKQFFDLPNDISKQCPADESRRGLDLTRDYAALVWTGADFSGKRIVHRIVVRRGLTDPYNVTLPGLESDTGDATLFELFLSPDESAEHSSLYVFSAQPDPLEAQIPAFVAAATGPLFASFAKLTGTHPQKAPGPWEEIIRVENKGVLEAQPPPGTVTAHLGTLKPPLKRAKVKITDVVRQPLPAAEFMKQGRALASKLKMVDARETTCAKAVADKLVAAVDVAAVSDVCTATDTTDEACRARFDQLFRTETTSASESCAMSVRAAVTKENEALPAEKRLNAAQLEAAVKERVEANLKAIQQVDGEFRKLVASTQPEQLTGEGAFVNAPLTYLGFGALTSVSLTASSNRPRVKVGNDGKLVADPLGRQMTLVVVNFAPKGYDPEQRPMSISERVRPFAGVVATPEFGLGAGLSVGIWKGVGVNLGAALLFVPTLNGGDEIGSPPADANDSFGIGRATAVFVGLSYNFK